MAIPFMAIGSLVSALMGANGAAQSNALQGASINETRRSNRASEKMAKSSRQDALGNVLRYVEGQGWVTDVTPIIRAILDGQSREQLATLTQDAPRARAASERKDARSISADNEYSRIFDKRQYGNEKQEGEYQADALIRASRQSRGGVPAAMLAQAMRSGDPKAMRDAAIASREAAPNVSDRFADAEQKGTQQYLAEKGARDQTFFNELNQLGQAANNTDGAQPYMADINGQMTGRSDNALQTLISVMQQGGQQMAGAYSNAAANLKTPDLSGVFSGLQEIQDGPAKAQMQAQQAALAKALAQAELEGKQLSNRRLRSSF